MPLPKSDYVSDAWKDGIFANKVIFCTGGAGTICSAQVRAIVHLGANACIIGRNAPKTESMARDIATARVGAKVLGIGQVDVRSLQSLEKAVETCVRELGAIDYVIAGAAGNFLAPIQQLSANAMKSVIDIDVLGSYNTLKATLPHLLVSAKQSKKDGLPGGRIIFVSATLHYTATPLQAHVCAAKAAVDSLSASASIELGPYGITSNVIAPGPIAGTEGMERLSKPENLEAVTKIIPLQRMGTVKDIADATVFLFGEAGSYLNGTVMVVDGGHWRMGSFGSGSGARYPEFLMSGEEVTGVKGGKKIMAKL